jgi:hypothetical protein
MGELQKKNQEKLSEKIQEKSRDKKTISGVINSVALALDSYDDIFSDFDASTVATRTISDDFTREIQKRYSENEKGDFEAVFSLPDRKRFLREESLIKKRLRDHYKKKAHEALQKINHLKKNGVHRIFIGFVLLILELGLRYGNLNFGVLSEFFGVLLIPIAWFTMWTGYELFFDRPSEFVEAGKFYRKFGNANYIFVSEELVTNRIVKIAGK